MNEQRTISILLRLTPTEAERLADGMAAARCFCRADYIRGAIEAEVGRDITEDRIGGLEPRWTTKTIDAHDAIKPRARLLWGRREVVGSINLPPDVAGKKSRGMGRIEIELPDGASCKIGEWSTFRLNSESGSMEVRAKCIALDILGKATFEFVPGPAKKKGGRSRK